MKLIVGLGNPGVQYRSTRHNVGFMAIDQLSRQVGIKMTANRWGGIGGKGKLVGEDILLVKPQTYMNISGEAIQPMAAYYKIPPKQLIVIHDDLDIPFGQIKLCRNKGPGGHNGLRSINNIFATKEYIRIRLGIDRPDGQIPVDRFVLANFTESQARELPVIITHAVDAVIEILTFGLQKATQKIHST